MSTSDIDMAAIQAAADLALAADPNPDPSTVLEAHSCQTGCGRLANIVMVRLADSDLDILCDVCWVTMALAIVAEIPVPEPSPAGPEGA